MPRRFVVFASLLLGLLAVAFAWRAAGLLRAPSAPPSPLQPIPLVVAPRLQGGSIDYRRLDDRLRRLVEEDGMVGLSVGVIEGGKLNFLKGYGETVAGSGERVTTSTVFRWASVSKGLAATMVAGLAEQGKLSLDDPIIRWAPSLHLPGGGQRWATVDDVLSHRVGIVSNAYDGKLEDGEDARALRRSFGELPALCAPGTCSAYQNIAFDAASEIVERVTGLPYEAAVRARLFGPLGMTSASVSREGLMSAKSWAQPHVGKGKPVEVSDAYYRVPAAGGVNSSIYDFALWLRAQMGGAPRILSPALLDTIHRPRVVTPVEQGRVRRFGDRLRGARYGLGWRDYDYLGHRVIGHLGGVRGHRSLILFDPERRTGVVALWNSASSRPVGLEIEVMDMVYGVPPEDWLKLDTGPKKPR
ncbi:MAG: class beta-lactamase-related serine hydrolase [Sphingomonas bacterium]|nr:class beta-lactamase-related serine hydrolase [Sphingomonas bacterium]MDB5719148.1 class beta-lactamase-related serine hydrolase [Sphingomonas bacterium]